MAMTTIPVGRKPAVTFFEAAIGKKVVMAVTGLVLFAYVIGHLIGNLQIYLGPGPINAYAEFLHSKPGLLWAVRILLLAALVMHVVAATQLTLMRRRARPIEYRMRHDLQATYASRTMMWSGPIILAFVVYHLLHLTTGGAHPSFVPGNVYHNVVAGFRQVPASLAYIVAMVLLGMHLYHGLYSMTQSVGLYHPRYTSLARRLAKAIAVLIMLGNISIPVAVLAGLVG